ncbi:bifunctional phosphopantothenoylcysteine decarboxylase/phosphopantothenate--cysteine ligase CoaBC [Ornithinimicrobium humiphilum]|uniref:Coenzyme A biosynthesis bifunctional protein CoaBC n=1 Tax=Ornithinimicrobium humiphilum TaxID=125288 RepID=A0A543KPL7_9MICO|nr:bifunctional phosphopantothenoylcysteine decarboxylase/phosphopantothenate--cysteine ligase CoaBC [Ornithinimicrobium humiphilum]TQM97019.1 phosphopantothenoylcysteine decarboxylase/phosphopantothenate--cysteine ligase [Ornithinimicrobium humiphilum]
MRVVLGVSGGIAAYKAALVLRLLTEAGHQVTVVPTAAALRFVGAPTWEALSGRAVSTEVWDDVPSVNHVRLGQEADLVLVAPATADLMARAAHGLADDLLTTTLLAARCPVVLAPAMHTEMWTHPATVANVATLRERGVTVLDPASGRLTGKDTGPGRLPDPEEIVAAALAAVAPVEEAATPADLAGRHVLVSAGGTREPLDPVRFLGNRSSGKQGYAVAAEAARRGARVTLVSANVELATPAGCDVVRVGTALELQEAIVAAVDAGDVDVVVMAAAVADFRPATYAGAKIKKTHGDGDDSAPTIELVRNPDVLAGLVAARGGATSPFVVGFAAETGDATGGVLDLARAKLARKGCDLLVANEVGADKTFGQDTSTVHLLAPGVDEPVTVGPASKADIARAIWDVVAARLS